MKTRLIHLSLFILTIISFFGCNRPIRYDLIVENASIFDTKTGTVIPDKTILIKGDTIVGIIDAGEPVRTRKVVDADGHLVTPGNIDTHINLEDALYSDHKNSENHPKTLTTFYRNRISRNYLPYGVTSVLEFGADFDWVKQIQEWKANSKFSEVLSSFKIEKNSYENSAIDLKTKELIQQALSNHVKYIYIKNDIDSSVFNVIAANAKENGMIVFASPNKQTIFDTNTINIENFYNPIINTFELYGEKEKLSRQIDNIYGKNANLPRQIYALEAFKYIIENNPALLDTISKHIEGKGVSISTTLHVMAELGGITYFTNNSNMPNLPKELKHRIAYTFNHMLNFVKKLHDQGVEYRIGTNSPNGGMAFVSEQLLLAEAGISAADILKISTINAAKALGIDSTYGSIEIGKKADLIIYDESPLEDTKFFASTRRVIKDGKLYKKNGQIMSLKTL